MTDVFESALAPQRVYRLLTEYFNSRGVEVKSCLKTSRIEVKKGSFLFSSDPWDLKVQIDSLNGGSWIALNYSEKPYFLWITFLVFSALVWIFLRIGLTGNITEADIEAIGFAWLIGIFFIAGESRRMKKHTAEIKAFLEGVQHKS